MNHFAICVRWFSTISFATLCGLVPLFKTIFLLQVPVIQIQMLTLYVNSNNISNVHVIFFAMCVLIVRHHIIVRGL